MKTPYLEVVDEPRLMKGKGAPRSTVFGVLGRTKMDPYTKSLGGLVSKTADAKVQPGTLAHGSLRSERGAVGMTPRTKISGEHYGQVPYPGSYMGSLGKRV